MFMFLFFFFFFFFNFQNGKGVIVHLESRPSKLQGMQFDVLTKVDISRRDLLILIRSLRQSSMLGEVTVLTDNSINVKGKRLMESQKVFIELR